MMAQLFVLATLLFACPEAPGESRLRTTDEKTALMFQRGLERSRAFRDLVAKVGAGDVIVFVDSNYFLPGRQTGRMKFIGRAGTWRYMRVSIRRDLPSHRFIASLAHELQHVSEVIEHPEVGDDASLERLYRRIGRAYHRAGRLAFETDAARRIATEVRREVTSSKLSTTRNTNASARQGVRTP